MIRILLESDLCHRISNASNGQIFNIAKMTMILRSSRIFATIPVMLALSQLTCTPRLGTSSGRQTEFSTYLNFRGSSGADKEVRNLSSHHIGGHVMRHPSSYERSDWIYRKRLTIDDTSLWRWAFSLDITALTCVRTVYSLERRSMAICSTDVPLAKRIAIWASALVSANSATRCGATGTVELSPCKAVACGLRTFTQR